MPPKKSSQKAQQQQQQQQQAVPDPQRQTRAGRKRRNSDTSNASDRPSSSHSIATPAKRRKRAKAAASVEPEVIVEEEEREVVDEEVLPTADVETVTEVVERPGLHVSFGRRQSSSIRLSETEKTTATHITPHPRKKLSIKRRQTGSPSLHGEVVGHKKFTTHRHSLPPSLSQDATAHVEQQDHEFSSLYRVVEARKQQFRERFSQDQARLEELQSEKQLGNTNEDLEAEIIELQQKLDDALQGADIDEDMYVLESQKTVTYPDLSTHSPLGESHETKVDISGANALTQSQYRSNEQIWSAERDRLESMIVSLSDQANERKTQLEILEIELSSLGLGEGDDSKTILMSIRESFLRVRESVDAILPGSLPEHLTNQDVIDILVANVKEFAARLKLQDKDLQGKSSLVANLSAQIDALIDRLAEADYRKEQLEQRLAELEIDYETSVTEVQTLTVQVQEIEALRGEIEDDLAAKQKEASSLFEDLAERDGNIDRLTQSLERYQSEEKRLSELITRMEEEHGTTLAKMNSEREETVRDLEDRYDEQAQNRMAVERLAEERQSAIDRLQLQVDSLEQDRDTLREQLDDMTTQRDEEADARETAEIDLQERTVEVEDLSTRVDRLEDELADLTAQLEELRQLNETERTQRETAENALDTTNEEVEKLNKKLQSQGAQANELRQKLWEVQQNHERQVKALEQTASDRDQQYQNDIQDEVDRREAAELESQERASTIEELQARLEEVELQMGESIAERDAKIVSLEEELAEKDAEIKTLRDDLLDANNRYDALEVETALEKQDLDGSISVLKATISKHEVTIAQLQQEALSESALHTSEIEDRNVTIAELNHEVAVLRSQVIELQSDKSGLERRVEQEAEQMLQLQADKEDQIEALKATIADKQVKIQVVEQKAHETDQRWQDLLNAREDDIRELREAQTSSTETVSVLESELQVMKGRFAEYFRRSSGRISRLQEDLAKAKATADEEGDAVIAEGESLLEEFEALGSMSATVTTKTTHSSSSAQKQVSRKTRSKKRVQDSGIGMDQDEDETMLAA